MTYLVSGGAGFIGSAVTRMLMDEGEHVVVVDKLTYAGHLSSLRDVAGHPNFVFVQADICNREAMTQVFTSHTPDAVMHLAAESHVDRSITSAGDFVRTNIVGTYEMLEAARRYWECLSSARKDAFRYLHVSTDEVYGSLGSTGAFREDTSYDPRSPYSASKAASDHLASAWWHTFGLPVVTSNCSNNYGPYQLPEKLIPLMILNSLEGGDLPIYGDGQQIRDWLYVDDHARALKLILQEGTVGETYNVGGRNEHTNLDVVRRICETTDRLAPSESPRSKQIRHVEDRPGHDRRYAIDATKIEQQLGWRALESFETGIERTIRWYMDNDWWWRPLREMGHGVSRLGLPPS